MTVDDLIVELSALPKAQRKLPAFVWELGDAVHIKTPVAEERIVVYQYLVDKTLRTKRKRVMVIG